MNASTTILLPAEAADFLKIPVEDLIEAAGAKELPAKCIRGHWRFVREQLEECVSAKNDSVVAVRGSFEAIRSTVGRFENDPIFESVYQEIALDKKTRPNPDPQ
jgi:hypothetical protein